MVLAGQPRAAGGFGVQAGGAQFDFVENLPAWGAASATTRTANTAYLTLVRVAKPITVTKMTYAIGVAAGTVDLGIYTFDGTNFVRQVSTGPTTAAGPLQTINLTASFTFQPGVDYWLAFVPSDGATLTVYRCAATGGSPYLRRMVEKAIGAATLPATIASAGVAGTGSPWLVAAP